MITSLLSLAFIVSPMGAQMSGVFCDEIYAVISEYQEETGVFSEEELEGLLGRCERYEEGDEENDK